MKNSRPHPIAILVTSIFILACSSVSLPSLATATPQTLVTIPAMPTSLPVQNEIGSGLENENLLVEVPD